jgi:Phage Tail Collar Domain
MPLTTKIVRQYQCCGQVMPVPVVIKKLACWRPPMPLQPPRPLQQPPLPPAPLNPQYQYHPYPQPYPYPHPVYAMQQQIQQPQQQMQQQYPQQQQIYAITDSQFQTQLAPSQNDSDSHYRQPPNDPIIEYSSDIIVLPGNIVIQTTDTVPDGYLLCDGADVSRTEEAVLFAAIGTFYGDGDESTTFCLPDLEDEERPTHHYMIKR